MHERTINTINNKTMFDVRQIQEQVIFGAVKAESNETTAQNIVNGELEDNPVWVKKYHEKIGGKF